MNKKVAFSGLLCLSLLSLVVGSQLANSTNDQNPRLTNEELEIVTRVNGTKAYDYDLELERIALNRNISNYSFRSSGSPGANETATWIRRQFESLSLDETHMESFEFVTWNLLSQPMLIIDIDGNQSTTADQVSVHSFQSEHYSWPTSGSVFSDLVVLPLPEASSRYGVVYGRINTTAWNSINTTGKILFIGREIRWSNEMHLIYRNKLISQPPAAVIIAWTYDWTSWIPPMFGSVGGLPASDLGSYYWDLRIPVGWVNYQDGLMIRNRETHENISAAVTIQAVIDLGPHYNVVGRIDGSGNSEKTVIVAGHYDTVMTPGFCDNGAGIAGVVELARVFSEAIKDGKYRSEYSILFVAFAGEELGLVGATYYMLQHEAELKNIIAVINLDCLGNELLEISETFVDDNGLNLVDIVLKAAEDLEVNAAMIETGGSDQEVFRNPMFADAIHYFIWKNRTGVCDMMRVKSSILLSTFPLFYAQGWSNGTPGWIHTSYDNSTSTETLGWVEVEQLQSHIQVAALSVIRVLRQASSPGLLYIYVGITAAGAAVAAVIYVKRSQARRIKAKVVEDILRYIGTRELVYITILTAIFLFGSFALHSRSGRIELADSTGYPVPVTVQYFGTPFEMFGIAASTVASVQETAESLPQWTQTIEGGNFMIWKGFVLNLVLCVLLAFITIYVIEKAKYRYEVARY